jgi:hypothetical protein
MDGLKGVDIGSALWLSWILQRTWPLHVPRPPHVLTLKGENPQPFSWQWVLFSRSLDASARLQRFAPIAPSSGYCAGPAGWVQTKSTATCSRVYRSNKTSACLLQARHSGSFSTAIPCWTHTAKNVKRNALCLAAHPFCSQQTI